MAYEIQPYEKRGDGEVNATGTTQIVAEQSKAFRNVAVGATIKIDTTEYTVVTKVNEETVNVNTAVTCSNKKWKYKNPNLTLSGIYYVKHNKSDKPTLSPIAINDANKAYASTGQGVVRDITLSGFIQSTTMANIYKYATILESLADGTQCRQGTCVYTEDVPPRSSYVWITSLNWQFSRDKPKWLDVMINMVECKNRGGT